MEDWRLLGNFKDITGNKFKKTKFKSTEKNDHEHCEFCWEKALTDKACTFYCTEDMSYWICEDCFRDFQNKFNWQERTAEELLSNPKL